MPPPRKVDLLPPELKGWLKEELERRGFGDYVQLADDLNARLSQAGQELRIQKTALHAFGEEHREFVKLQEAAGAWAEQWMQETDVEDHAKRSSILFQMAQTLAFKIMRSQMAEGAEPDPKDLHFLGRLLKDITSASGDVQKQIEADRKRRATEQAAAITKAVDRGDLDAEAGRKAREIIFGAAG